MRVWSLQAFSLLGERFQLRSLRGFNNRRVLSMHCYHFRGVRTFLQIAIPDVWELCTFTYLDMSFPLIPIFQRCPRFVASRVLSVGSTILRCPRLLLRRMQVSVHFRCVRALRLEISRYVLSFGSCHFRGVHAFCFDVPLPVGFCKRSFSSRDFLEWT